MPSAEELRDQAQALMMKGQFGAAADLLGKAIQTSEDGRLWHLAGVAMCAAGRIEDATTIYERAFELHEPAEAILWEWYGNYLPSVNRWSDAEAAYRKALEMDPGLASAWLSLGMILSDAFRVDEAKECVKRAIELGAAPQVAAVTLSKLLLLEARYAEAAEVLQNVPQSAWRDPTYVQAYIWLSLHDPKITGEELRRRHELFGGLFPRQSDPRLFRNDRNPDRKIRIGFVSPDFRRHSVAFFLRALWEHLDRDQFEVIGYHTLATHDAVTEWYQENAAKWRSVHGTPPQDLIRQFHTDKVDVLVDLCGHTMANRLVIFGMRAAPVQVTYLGYAATTGLKAMDYRIIDAVTDPPGDESHSTEQLIRLDPCFLCFAPDPDVTLERGDGPVTLGSFNELSKTTDEVFDLWVSILNRVPEANFIHKSAVFADQSLRERWMARYESAGVSRERVRLIPRTKGYLEHLDLYNQVDVTVDPWPYNGTTTTAEALAMGIPVLTTLGDRHICRVSASILRTVGRPEWVLPSHEATADEAVKLLQAPRTTEERRALRQQFLDSPFTDGQRFADQWGQAIRSAWHTWCVSTR